MPAGVESKYDFFAFELFVPIGVESKGGQLIGGKLSLSFLIVCPNLKLSFIVIFLV